MKKTSWMALSAVLLVGLFILSYASGYQVGADVAEAENRAEEAE